jgi:hypothetical protein
MKLATLMTGIAMIGLVTVGDASLNLLNPTIGTPVQAAEAKSTGPSVQEKVDMIVKHKGKIGSGDQLRRFFYGDLEPIGIQPGGTGMVVNLYNKENNITFSYCSTYDVVVAVKSGKVTQFLPSEVK